MVMKETWAGLNQIQLLPTKKLLMGYISVGNAI